MKAVQVVLVFVAVAAGLASARIRDGSSTCSTKPPFLGFAGQVVLNAADCTWDYFRCENGQLANRARDVDGASCCKARFEACCAFLENPVDDSATTEAAFTTGSDESTTEETTTTTEKPYVHADTFIGCIWQFNGCVESSASADAEALCYSRFDDCKMIVMGMAPASTAASTPVAAAIVSGNTPNSGAGPQRRVSNAAPVLFNNYPAPRPQQLFFAPPMHFINPQPISSPLFYF